jgi:hypothetical protein
MYFLTFQYVGIFSPPPNIPILPLFENSGFIFQTFFCLEYELRNVFSENFEKKKKRGRNGAFMGKG